jgi:DNA-binding MarR family transcriptional regulator
MNASKLRLYHRLQIAAHGLRKAADRAVLEAGGVTTAQAAVLAIVAARETATQRDVANALRINESAVTAMATRLIKLGILERIRSGTDNRAWCLSLSSAGLMALRASLASINARIESEFSQLETKQLVDYLDRLTAAFEEHWLDQECVRRRAGRGYCLRVRKCAWGHALACHVPAHEGRPDRMGLHSAGCTSGAETTLPSRFDWTTPRKATMRHIHGLDIPTTLATYAIRSMALLVYDMQAGIRSQIKTGNHVVGQAGRVLSAAQAAGMRVVFTRHLSLPKAWMGSRNFARP